MVGHMYLNVPFTVKHHLTFDALVRLLLKKKKGTKGKVIIVVGKLHIKRMQSVILKQH